MKTLTLLLTCLLAMPALASQVKVLPSETGHYLQIENGGVIVESRTDIETGIDHRTYRSDRRRGEYNCDYYGNLALDLVTQDGRYEVWEYQYALQICTRYALEAFKKIRDSRYLEWEMKWASKVNTPTALEASQSHRQQLLRVGAQMGLKSRLPTCS